MIKKIFILIITIASLQQAYSQPCTRNSQCMNEIETFLNMAVWWYGSGSGHSFNTRTLDTITPAWQSTYLAPGTRYRLTVPGFVAGTGNMIIEITACSNDDVNLGFTTGPGTRWGQDINNYSGCSGNFGTTGERAMSTMQTVYNSYIWISGDSAKTVTDSVEVRYRLLYRRTPGDAGFVHNPDSMWLGTVYNGLTGYNNYYQGNHMFSYGNEDPSFTRDFGTGQPGGYSALMCPDTTCEDNDSFQIVYTKNINLSRTFLRIRSDYIANGGMSLKTNTAVTLVSNSADATALYDPSYGNQWILNFLKRTGNFKTGINICQMAGDNTFPWTNSFKAYTYNGGSAENNYQGVFYFDSLRFAYNWGTGTPESLLDTNRCGKTFSGSNYYISFQGRNLNTKGQYKYRVRLSGGTASFSYYPIGGSSWINTITNATSDVTSSLITMAKDTAALRLLYNKTGSTGRISFNFAKQPKNPGSMHSTQDTVCLGGSVTLSVDTVDGTETQWYKNACAGAGIYIGSGATITVTPDSSTTYYARNREYRKLADDTLNVLELISTACASKRIYTNPVPDAPVAPSSQSVCSDTAYTFTFDSVFAGAGGDQVEWATNSDFTGSTIEASPGNISHTVDAGEQDTIWVRSRVSGTGCVSEVVLMIATTYLNPLPPSVENQSTCSDTSYIFIFDSIVPGYGADQIEWSTNSDFISSTIVDSPTSIIIAVDPTEQDTLWIRSKASATGCVSATSIVTASVNTAPVAHAGYDVTICKGESIQIGDSITATQGSSPYIYRWISLIDLSIDSNARPIISPEQSGTYILAAIDANYCVGLDTLSVLVNVLPDLPVIPDMQVSCVDTVYTFTFDSVFAGLDADKVEWATNSSFSPSNIINSGSDFNITVYPGNIDTIWLRSLIDSTGCVSSAVRSIATTDTFNTYPPIAPQSAIVCSNNPSSVVFDNIIAGACGDEIEWATNPNFDSSTIITSPGSISIIIQPEATDTIWIRSRRSAKGTISSSVTTTASVRPLPIANAGIDTTICSNAPLKLGADSTGTGGNGVYSFSWEPALSLDDSTFANPIATPGVSTNYKVTVIDGNGCTAIDTINITTLSLPGLPTIPMSQTVCSDTLVVFNFTDTVGVGGQAIEWARNSNFYASHIIPSPATILSNIGPGAKGTVYFRSKDTITGCVSASVFANIQANILPSQLTPIALLDTICSGVPATIVVPNSQLGTRYNLETDSILSSDYGNGDSLYFNTGDLATTSTFSIVAIDTSTGCSSHLSSTTINIASTLSSPRFITGDTLLYYGETSRYSILSGSPSSTHYFIDTGDAEIDSLTGWVNQINSSFIIKAVTSSSVGCDVLSAYIPVTYSINPSTPVTTAETSQSAWSDTAVTFIIKDIKAGRGADEIEWSADSLFTGSQTFYPAISVSSERGGNGWQGTELIGGGGSGDPPAQLDIPITLIPGALDKIWMRSKDHASNRVSEAVSYSFTNYELDQKAGASSASTQYVNLPLGTGGTGNPVGVTPGFSGTTPFGGATYTIPIVCPPGINGVMPKVSLNYNSHAGNGVMGHGWALGGLSFISRSGLDNMHDQEVAPITLSYDDAFTIDGTRLTLKSGLNGHANAIYAKEVEDYSVIKAVGSSVNGPDWFEVTTKEGIVMEYGHTDDSKFLSIPTGSLFPTQKVLQWRLSKVYDQDGNYMSFRYDNTGNGGRIMEILYTGNSKAGVAPFCAMLFDYEKRFDPNVAYTAGTLISSDNLLTQIRITSGNNGNGVFKKYVLDYSNDGLSSYLASITEHGTDGTHLNPTVFEYGGSPNYSGYEVVSSSSDVNWGWNNNPYEKIFSTNVSTSEVSGDFNGDGYSDRMVLYTANNSRSSSKNLTPYNLAFMVDIMDPATNNFVTKDRVQKDPRDPTFILCESPLAESVVSGNTQRSYSNDVHENYDYYIGDFLGSGKDGILEVQRICDDLLNIGSINYYSYSNTGALIKTAFSTPPTTVLMAAAGHISLGDFDGDGTTDYILYTKDGSYISFPSKGLFNESISSGSTFINGTTTDRNASYSHDGLRSKENIEIFFCYAQVCYGYTYLTDHPTTNPHFTSYVADYNGDGKSDLMVVTPEITYLYSIEKDGTDYSFQRINSFNYPNLNNSDQLYLGDFNGDGKTDIITHQKNGTSIPTNLTVPNSWLGNTYTNNWLIPSSNATERDDLWTIGFSTGHLFQQEAFLENKFIINPPGSSSYGMFTSSDGTTSLYHTEAEYLNTFSSSQSFNIGDFNGDGKSDVLFNLVPLEAKATKLVYKGCTAQSRVYYSNGIQFKKHLLGGLGNIFSPATMLGDFNGDGRHDIVFYNTERFDGCNLPANTTSTTGNASIDDYFQISFNAFSKERLLHTVTNGFEQVTSFAYKPLTDPTIHTKGTTQTSSLFSIQRPIYVLSTISIPNGIGGIHTTSYTYRNALTNKGGMGFLGYEKILSNSSALNTAITRQTTFASPYYSPINILETVTVAGNDILITNKNFNQIKLANNHYKIENSISESFDLLSRAYTVTNNTYDAYGNIFNTSTDVNGIENTTVTISAFSKQGNSTVPMRPLVINTNKTRSGRSYFNTASYTYNSQGKLETQSTAKGRNCNVQYIYSYDRFGNRIVTTTYTATTTGGSRTGVKTYDGQGRFPVSESNALAQNTLTTYDKNWGKPLSITSVDNNTISYSYDGYGRVTATVPPRGSAHTITTTYSWDVDNGGSNSMYSITTSQLGKPIVVEWEDALGRSVKTQATGFGSSNLTSTTTYTGMGRKATVTAPHYSDESPSYQTFAYDWLDRITSITDQFAGHASAISYTYDGIGNLNTTTTQAGRSTTKTTDITGKMISASDPGGTLTYKYDGAGNNIEVKNGSVVVMSATYDDCNHLVSQTEPNGGLFSYTYDGYGQLLHQVDGNSNTYDMRYDVLGRLTQKTGSLEGTSYYSYYAGGDGNANKVSSISGFDGIWQHFTYTDYGEVESVEEEINGDSYTTTYGYDAVGNCTSTTYPSGIEIVSNYDSYGYLTSIVNANTDHTLYVPNKMNSYGQATEYTLGNGLTSEMSSYFGLPTQYYTESIQDLQLQYDYANGDLMQRKDNIHNITEVFTYDGSDRLLSAKVGIAATMYFGYANNGNITSKTDAGMYIYGSGKINAITSVSNEPGNISNSTQNITYIGFNKARTITENDFELNYTYAADFSRKYSELKHDNTIINTRIYSGTYELNDMHNGVFHQIHYVYGNGRLVSIVVKDNEGNIHESYTYTDHLGSILTVTDDDGDIIAQQNFDAWGRNRNFTNWTYTTGSLPPPEWLYRGYTGHEMLPEFGLINMNGRMYDPILGRMLSPDNCVQFPSLTQSYNKYTYCLNNPLKYTDPSGWQLGDGWFTSAFTNWTYTTPTNGYYGPGYYNGYYSSSYSYTLVNYSTANYSITSTSWAFNVSERIGFGELSFTNNPIVSLAEGMWAPINGALDFVAQLDRNPLGTLWNTASNLVALIGLANGTPYLYSARQNAIVDNVSNAVISYYNALPSKSYLSIANDIYYTTGYIATFALTAVLTSGAGTTAEFSLSVENAASRALTAETRTALELSFPPNNGALGEWGYKLFSEGDDLVRFSKIGRNIEDGHFMAPSGTTWGELSLPYTEMQYQSQTYSVTRSFGAWESQVRPWYNQPGLGQQYLFKYNLEWYIQNGFLQPK